MRPQKQMTNLPAPRSSNELRAPKTATIRGGRGVPAAGPQSTTYARLNWGKMDRGQSFSLTEDSPKTASTASVDPLDEAPAPSHRSASLREQKGKPAARAESLSQCSSKERNFHFGKTCRYSNKERGKRTSRSSGESSGSPITPQNTLVPVDYRMTSKEH